MRMWLILGLLAWHLSLVPAASADDQIQILEERVKKLEQRLKEQDHREQEGLPLGIERPEMMKPPGPSAEPGLGPLPEVGRDQRTPQASPLSFGTTGSGRLIYAKPFVSSPKAIVGGYMDFFYTMTKKGPVTPQGSIDNGAVGNLDRGILECACVDRHILGFVLHP